MKIAFTLLLLGLCLPGISAQGALDEEAWLRYCIGVKGRFHSGSECLTSRKPAFESLKIELWGGKETGSLIEQKDGLTQDALNEKVYFDYLLKGAVDFSSDSFKVHLPDNRDLTLYYDLRVSEIKNDTRSHGTFFNGIDGVVGLNVLEEIKASDPCSNSFNWLGKDEFYSMSFDVIVDDPVPL